MIGPAPDLAAIATQADDLARNDRLPMPQREGLYLLTGMAGRGALYAAIGAEMIAARACGEPDVVDGGEDAATAPGAAGEGADAHGDGISKEAGTHSVVDRKAAEQRALWN